MSGIVVLTTNYQNSTFGTLRAHMQWFSVDRGFVITRFNVFAKVYIFKLNFQLNLEHVIAKHMGLFQHDRSG